jgi:hypothetical protein
MSETPNTEPVIPGVELVSAVLSTAASANRAITAVPTLPGAKESRITANRRVFPDSDPSGILAAIAASLHPQLQLAPDRPAQTEFTLERIHVVVAEQPVPAARTRAPEIPTEPEAVPALTIAAPRPYVGNTLAESDPCSAGPQHTPEPLVERHVDGPLLSLPPFAPLTAHSDAEAHLDQHALQTTTVAPIEVDLTAQRQVAITPSAVTTPDEIYEPATPLQAVQATSAAGEPVASGEQLRAALHSQREIADPQPVPGLRIETKPKSASGSIPWEFPPQSAAGGATQPMMVSGDHRPPTPIQPASNILDRVLALGQSSWAKHTILTSSPMLQDEPNSKDRPLPPEPPRTEDTTSADLAFSMRLSAILQPTAPEREPIAVDPHPSLPQASAAPLPNLTSTPASAPATPAAKSDRARSEEEPEPDRTDTRPTTPTPRLAPQLHVESAAPPERTEPTPRSEAPRQAHPSVAAPPEPPAAPKPAGAARDIKLQLAGAGSQRVDVHLIERAGQVQVAVRTPDSHLAGTLRDNLPTLSARLAESGIRSEAWHPSASATEPQRTGETSRSGQSQDHNPQSGGQHQEQQSGGEPRRPKLPEAPMERKEKGKDFTWFMSTLQ